MKEGPDEPDALAGQDHDAGAGWLMGAGGGPQRS